MSNLIPFIQQTKDKTTHPPSLSFSLYLTYPLFPFSFVSFLLLLCFLLPSFFFLLFLTTTIFTHFLFSIFHSFFYPIFCVVPEKFNPIFYFGSQNHTWVDLISLFSPKFNHKTYFSFQLCNAEDLLN